MSKSALPASVTGADLARVLNVSLVHVGRLARDGILPKGADGKYPFVPSIHAFLANQKRQQQTVTARQQEARARWTEERAHAAMLVRLEKEGELLRRDEIERGWMAVMNATKQHLLAVSNRLGSRLAGKHSPADIAAIVRGEIHQALNRLSETVIEPTEDVEDEPEPEVFRNGKRKRSNGVSP